MSPTFAPIGGGIGKATITNTTGSPTIDTSSRPGKTIYIFNGSGSITVGNPGYAEVLIIAGGGGGGQYGGGGAGGYYYEESQFLPSGSLTVTVGAGGKKYTSQTPGTSLARNGNSSFIGKICAIGGGAGGSNTNNNGNGMPGGSGGGGSGQSGGGDFLGGETLSSFQGNPGGSTGNSGNGGGGGGAGSAGSAGSSGGAGGSGLASSITGSSITRASGGSHSGSSAAANTGNGGGGQGSSTGYAGGSGVVIVVIG